VQTSSAFKKEQKTSLWQSISFNPSIAQVNVNARVKSHFTRSEFGEISTGYQPDFHTPRTSTTQVRFKGSVGSSHAHEKMCQQ
jgi:hypothetical protein